MFVSMSILLAGCASLPDLEVIYFAAKSEPMLILTQSLTCDNEFNNVFQAANLTTSVSHTANTSESYSVQLKNFDGPLTSGNVTINHYPDGRLNSINGTSTGQGLPIIQGVASVAGSILGLDFNLINTFSDPNTEPSLTPKQKSKLIKDICGAINPTYPVNPRAVDGVMTLIFTSTYETPDSPDYNKLKFKKNNSTAFERLESALKETLGETESFMDPVIKSKVQKENNCLVKQFKQVESGERTYICLKKAEEAKTLKKNQIRVQNSKTLEYTVEQNFNSKLLFIPDAHDMLVANISVASNSFYFIPFKSENLFGQNQITLTLTPMGTLNNLSYNSTSGVADALNAANTVLGEFQGQTAQEAANEIAQTQRLLRCRADEENCQ